MSNAKGKGGTGRGTGKKGWNRWQAAANRQKVPRSLIKVKVQRRRTIPKLQVASPSKYGLTMPEERAA